VDHASSCAYFRPRSSLSNRRSPSCDVDHVDVFTIIVAALIVIIAAVGQLLSATTTGTVCSLVKG
jgi:hypothetical protein